jgi:fatty acid amide hydrolase
VSLPTGDLFALPATSIARLLAAREVSSEEVSRAHLDRIEAADGRIHAFTSVLRDAAIASARRADEELRRGESRGPLHGMPVTVKESIDMSGEASTLGVVARRDHVSREDGGMVQLLREAGAVILGRTNVSQLLLFHESRNPLFGQTANPWSLAHTPGGSSGGEAAALAAGMSPLGVGTDIGGSIRVPAHFSGIAGLKPTLDRWTNKGSNGALLGQEAVRSQIGPMARTARDVALLFGAVDPRRMAALDPRVPPLSLRDPAAIDVRGLRVGFFVDDGLVPVSRAVARAVEIAVAALRSIGVAVVAFTPPGIIEAIYGYFAALSADGGAAALRALEGSEVDVSLKSLVTMATLPAPVRRAAARLAGLAGEKRLARLLGALGEKSAAELWRLTWVLREVRSAIFAALRAEGIDVLLCPPFATPALPHGLSRDFTLAGSPSLLWNIVQFPAGVVPVTRVEAGETKRARAKDRVEKRAAEVDAESAGLPVGVQVVGRPWQDEEVLAVMIALEDALAGRADRPVTPTLP